MMANSCSRNYSILKKIIFELKNDPKVVLNIYKKSNNMLHEYQLLWIISYKQYQKVMKEFKN